MTGLELPLLGLALGGAKYLASDLPRERGDRAERAENMRNSPWSNLRPKEIREADLFGGLMTGGLTGASLGQGMASQDMAKENMAAQNEYFKARAARERAAVDSAIGNPTEMEMDRLLNEQRLNGAYPFNGTRY